ncbi:MAG: hypothetical protein FH756_17915 [Firmicutes bacterium]|nr:hypothetical protein [Bacillota bacterium]
MKKFNLNKVLTMVFFVCLCIFLVVVSINKPRVLVLHSYATDFSWVTDINEGIERIMEKKPYSIRYHYMDTKRHPDAEFKEKAGMTARKMVEGWKPNVIIAVDDNASEYVAKHFNNDPEVNIVFTGLNATPEKYDYDKAANVTGMLERIPYDALKEVYMQVVTTEDKSILHISDSSETSLYIHDELVSFPWEPLQLVDSIQCQTFDEWKRLLKENEEKADFLLVTHYHTLQRSQEDNSIVPPQEVMEWTMQNIDIPAIGCWGFNVEDGGMMAVGVSPYEQGEVAAEMAIDILENKKEPSKIPIASTELFVMYLQESGLEKHNVKLPTMYEAFARATNSYFE